MTFLHLDRLRRDGLVELGPAFTEGEAQVIRDHLLARPVYNSHVQVHSDRQPRSIDATRMRGEPVACYSMGALLKAPGFLERIVTAILPAAEQYLECEPVLYSVNAWWSFPSGPVKEDTQTFHRDDDDERFLACFVFLTDVGEDGAHQLIKGSHQGPPRRADEPVPEIVPHHILQAYGPPGTAILSDTRGLHRGLKPLHNMRLIAWARFGVSDPPRSYVWDKLMPQALPAPMTAFMSEKQRRVCRLIVR